MLLKEIIAIADSGYPDGLVQQYHEHPTKNHGDTLAQFIAAELQETFDVNASGKQQLDTARRSIGAAVNQLRDVYRGLDAARIERID